MIVEVVRTRDSRKGVQVVSPSLERLTPDAVRHHTTHAHPVVCVECSRALSPEQVGMREASGVVCVDCCQ